MGSLSNQYISQSFVSLIHLGNDSTISSSFVELQDGLGNGLGVSVNALGQISASGNIYGANITGSSVNTGSLVTTSSFNSYTSSTNARLTSIEATTASLNNSVSALNQFTASQSTASIVTSITNLNSFTSSQNTKNTTLAGVTSSLQSFTASAQISINALNTFTASQSTASIVTSINNLNTFSASTLTRLTNIESTTASLNTSITNLNTATASLFTSASLSLTTASFDTGSRNLTFRKGNGTQFSVNIPDVSGSSFDTSSFATTGSNTFTGPNNFNDTVTLLGQTIFSDGQFANLISVQNISGSLVFNKIATASKLDLQNLSLLVSGTFTASLQQGYVWVGNGNGKTSLVATSSFIISGSTTDISSLNAFTASQYVSNSFFITTSSFNSYTSSNNQRVSSLETNSASVNISIANLNSATSSLFTSASLSLTTASVSGQLLSFIKGNNSTFTITLPTGSGTYVTGSYGAFHDETTQSGSANTPHLVKFSNTDISDGVILSGSTGLKVGTYGVYNLQFSLQAKRISGTGTDTLDVWFRKNGIDIPWSNTSIGLDGGAEATRVVPAWNYMSTLNINDTLEIVWQATDANVQLIAEPAAGSLPAIPSVIATLNRVDVGGGSNSVSTSSFNAYTSSTNIRLNNLESTTASLNTATASLFTSASLTLTTASVNLNTITFTKGDGTTFPIIVNTGSAGQSFINPTLTTYSGSLILSANGQTSSSFAFITASVAGGSGTNLILNGNTTGTMILSGSSSGGNILSTPNAPAAGFVRYINGFGNIIIQGSSIPSYSGSMQFPVNINGNYFTGTGTISLRGPVSASAWTINSNIGFAPINVGSSAANHAQQLVGSLNVSNNLTFGALNVRANAGLIAGSSLVSTNISIGGTTLLNMASSSINYSLNVGAATINNGFINAGAASGSGNNSLSVQGNFFYGLPTINVSGSDAGGPTNPRTIQGNLIYQLGYTDSGEAVNLNLNGSGSSLANTMVFGLGNIITGSNIIDTNTAASPKAGSLFFGRWNANDGVRNKTAENIFSIGTGTSNTNRKTGFLIDSGSNTFVEGTLNVSGATSLNGNLIITGSLTASLQNGYTFVGNASGITTLVATSSFSTTINTGSFATTGSNTFIGTEIITGSLILTGSAYGNVVSMSIASNTASMDLSLGNYFTLTLADTATTHISASNVLPGVSATLVITTGTNSSASLAPTMLQPSGSAYAATNGVGKKDILSIVAVASGTPYVVSSKNMI
jgi:hypothetical protein